MCSLLELFSVRCNKSLAIVHIFANAKLDVSKLIQHRITTGMSKHKIVSQVHDGCNAFGKKKMNL